MLRRDLIERIVDNKLFTKILEIECIQAFSARHYKFDIIASADLINVFCQI